MITIQDGLNGRIRTLSQETISKCPMFSFDPDHYLPDGTCLCFNKQHQDRLKEERVLRRAKLLKAQEKQHAHKK